MKRLEYSNNMQELLEEIEEESCYWRYQSAHHNGLIPVGHESHERMFAGEEPEHIEEGCSCYDNPWQLLKYMEDEVLDLDKTDVVLFIGEHMGYGIDEEDIVKVTEEEDILYSLSLRDFYKFIFNIKEDIHWNGYNIKEDFIDYAEDFIESVFSK